MLYLQAVTPAYRVRNPGAVASMTTATKCNPSARRGAAAYANVAIHLTTATASLLLMAHPAVATTITGMARAVDGDTLQVEGTRIRLFGMDAPEKAQLCKTGSGSEYACGQQAMDALKAQVAKGPVRCTVRTADQYGRSVATCQLPSGDDAGEFMVKNGLAVAYRQYSSQYIAAEDAARAARRGIWQGQFEVPSEWRKRTKAQEALLGTGVVASVAPAVSPTKAEAPAAAPSRGCEIKGNISAKGERIYHVPGGKYFESVKIDTDKGERWFCSEAEAEQAGWRRSTS